MEEVKERLKKLENQLDQVSQNKDTTHLVSQKSSFASTSTSSIKDGTGNETYFSINSRVQKLENNYKAVGNTTKQLQEILAQKKSKDSLKVDERLRQIEERLKEKQDQINARDQIIEDLKHKLQSQKNSRHKQLETLRYDLIAKDKIIKKLKQNQQKIIQKTSFLSESIDVLKMKLFELVSQIVGSEKAKLRSNGFNQLDSAVKQLCRKNLESSIINNQQNQLKLSQFHSQQLRLQRQLMMEAGLLFDEKDSFEEQNELFQSQMKKYIRFGNQFATSQLISNLQHKQWLLGNIKQFCGGMRLRAKLIFKFDPLNSTNFHKYIDGRPHILLVVRLCNGNVLGGYCSTPIQKGRVDRHKKGFLFSLVSCSVPTPIKYLTKDDTNQPMVTYDDYFLIFGNSELRIKSLETKMYSNFGVSSGMFNTGGQKVDHFLGIQGNEIGIETYEVYQIISK